MKKRYVVLLEIFIVLFLAGVYFVKEVIPLAKKENYFSDMISPKKYAGMVELQIDDTSNFAVVFDSNHRIYHIFYFDEVSTCIQQDEVLSYSSLEEAVSYIVTELSRYHILKENSSVTLTMYDHVPSEFYSIFQKSSISSLVSEKKSSLVKKANSLEIHEEQKNMILYELDYYSKNILSSDQSSIIAFDKNSSLKLANNVYLKLEKYMLDHHIQNMDREQKELLIEEISGDEYNLYYPNSNSWFSILDGKLYAYIEFTHQDVTYGYCYQGSIDFKKEGEC